jgi:intergrase/recombinase
VRRLGKIGAGNGIRTHAAQRGHRLSSPNFASFYDFNLKNNGFIDFRSVRGDFVVWLEIRGLSKGYRRAIVRHLERFGRPIGSPMDVVRIFQCLTVGQKHQVIRAVRSLLNFYEVQGLARREWLDLLRRNIPKDEVGIDLRIPSEAEIVRSLRKLGRARRYKSYFAVYNLILDSGLRLSEAIRFFSDFAEGQIEECDGFCVAPLGYMRKNKTAYYAFFTRYTMDLLGVARKITYESARGNVRKRLGKDIISSKYLRKFAFDKMIELEVPESVADFIQGRVAKRIGAKHYMVLVRQAKKFYPRYGEYIKQLRQKALN